MLIRQFAALLPVLLLLLVAAGLTGPGQVAVVGASVVAFLVAAAIVAHGRNCLGLLRGVASTRGPTDDERCLRGAFRRHSKPDTPGRPGRPRAPGRTYRPA